MKKLFLFLFFAITFVFTLAAQESSSGSEGVNEQYEMFSWEPVAKAKQYGVTVERYNSDTDTWSEYKTVKTKETQLEILFTPGIFRVSICTYNLIGRKGKSSDWVSFKILEENIPYLNERFLPKSKVWNAPVLFINRSGNAVPGGSDAQNYIQPPEGFDKNTILIKGRNIFSPKTEFYLVPKEENSEGGVQFVNYCDDRKQLQLNVVQRNSKEFSVVVSYNPDELKSGYYELEVRNQGDNRDSIELLVLDDTAVQIQPEKGFVIDENYKVNTFLTKNNGQYEFSIKGKGFNSATKFYLEPARGTYTFPFETEMNRQNAEVFVTGTYKQGAGSAQITMACPLENLRTGYYNLVASNWDGSSVKFICLVKKSFDNDFTKQVKTLKTKYNKRSDDIDVTIQDDKCDFSKTYTLVSAYDKTIDSNNRVKLSLSPSGKKLTGKLAPDMLTIAKYALLIEDENSYDVVYCDIDSSLRISQDKMTENTVVKTFFRPADTNETVTLNADDVGSVVYADSAIKMKKYIPLLFSNIRFDMSLIPGAVTLYDDGSSKSSMTTVIDGEIDLIHYGYFTFSGGYEYKYNDYDSEHSIFGTARVAIPNNYFQPYLGAGMGQTLRYPSNGINGIKKFSDATNIFKKPEQVYAFAHVGVNLLTVFDLRYNLILHDINSSPYFEDTFSFGYSFPIRPYKFKRKVITQSAQISKAGAIDGSSLIEKERKIPVDKIEIFSGYSVGGFAGYNDIKSVSFDSTVGVIEESAFADCKNLTNVIFNPSYSNPVPLTIKPDAFAGVTTIESITLPKRTSVVRPGAFEGWTSGQIIILDWSKEDATERDLSGLLHCTATVLYNDGEVFKGSFNTPLENAKNWCGINELKVKNVSVHQDDVYKLGIKLYGYAAPWYKVELDTWINQETPAQLVDYLRTGDRIKFSVQGDGNSYNLILTTQDGGYFYYKFKTKKGKVTQVVVPYKKLKKYDFSSQKKLDIYNIKMCCFAPMFKGELCDASFFDFEVTNNEKKN